MTQEILPEVDRYLDSHIMGLKTRKPKATETRTGWHLGKTRNKKETKVSETELELPKGLLKQKTPQNNRWAYFERDKAPLRRLGSSDNNVCTTTAKERQVASTSQ